ncbi:acyltransferase [Parasphingorhabdus cellanae]|uniref:Acyltransferase n=1 Tax=Parasphingorhabdus cellanae TaxID=2806553 RepID=A0ABX7T5B5_9SPHN|nr:acyltransferase [Parasphingorhabdus cellanae]
MHNYLSIQYLRGIAALMVVILHLFTGSLFIEKWSNTWLRGGVDIFFVISGFIMVKSTINKRYSILYFYLKRIIRIVPLYWLAIIITIQSSTWTGWHSIASFLFLPAVHPENGAYLPIL